MWHDFVVPPEPMDDDGDLHVSEFAWDLITRFWSTILAISAF